MMAIENIYVYFTSLCIFNCKESNDFMLFLPGMCVLLQL